MDRTADTPSIPFGTEGVCFIHELCRHLFQTKDNEEIHPLESAMILAETGTAA